MNDTVVIPTFDRPEFLWVCLENLYDNVRGAREKFYVVSEDIHTDKPKDFTTQMEMLATIREWSRKLSVNFSYTSTAAHSTYGNSLNVLSALQYSKCVHPSEKVYLIEDDVLVTPDFFEWNDAVFDLVPNAHVVCAGRLNRSLNFQMNGPQAIDESIKDPNACGMVIGAYNSWATCFKSGFINVEGVDYSKFRPGYEQDIMIQDNLRRSRCVTIWPYVPRAYHFGWYSYHRTGGMPLTGDLEQRVKAIQKIVTNKQKLQEMAGAQEIDAFPTQHHEAATKLYIR
jgi:hypothetical protein